MHERKATTIISGLKELWQNRHGNPAGRIVRRSEFNRNPFRRALQKNMIDLKTRPERRRNGTGLVEQ